MKVDDVNFKRETVMTRRTTPGLLAFIKAWGSARRSMLWISPSNSAVAVINVFTVAPEDQQRLVDLLTRATQRGVAYVPGFVAAALHRSLDGRKVTMYAQWQSIDHYERMRARPDASSFLAEALKIATFEPGLYHVAAVFEPSGNRMTP